ncbi:PIN-like domain-containing protein [Burkholderia ubonensis]|uniref:PIN-like domain-containing protein n=1 Tax=Burkholderia ubonensis TaxID=101571 RepID=UPI000A968D35|nr:PIN-like domain-containing protein [Burkholderia ubonensis]
MFKALAEPSTLIFVDTNVLAMPFRLHRRARQGLYRLLQKPIQDKRLIVPGWVANEYFHNAFLKAGSHGFSESMQRLWERMPKQSELVQHLRRTTSHSEQAYLAEKLGQDDVNGIDLIANRLDHIKTLLGNVGKELSPSDIHDELVATLEGCFSSLDFSEHCDDINALAERRRINRIPPGLTDDEKTENADGDLAIWLEILEIASRSIMQDGSQFERVLFLTQEQKNDYVYAPKSRLRDDNDSISEKNSKPEVWIIDPRLVAEFESRVGLREIAITSVDHLAAGAVATIPGGDPKKEIGDLLAELNREQTSVGSAETHGVATAGNEDSRHTQAVVLEVAARAELEDGEVGAPGVADAIAAMNPPELAIPERAKSDEKSFEGEVDNLTYRSVFDGLNSHNWYMQNDAVKVLVRNKLPQNLGWCFLLGRAVCQAAEGNAWDAVDLLLAMDHPDADIRQQAFVAGAIYEGFFDPEGNIRQSFKLRALKPMLEFLEKPYYVAARTFLANVMRQHEDRFYWLPGEPRPNVEIAIRTQADEEGEKVSEALVNVTGFREKNLLRHEADNDLRWLYSSTMSIDALVTNVADRVLLGRDDIRIRFDPPNSAAATAPRLDAAVGLVFDTEVLATPDRVAGN